MSNQSYFEVEPFTAYDEFEGGSLPPSWLTNSWTAKPGIGGRAFGGRPDANSAVHRVDRPALLNYINDQAKSRPGRLAGVADLIPGPFARG